MIDIIVSSYGNNFKYGICKAQFKAFQRIRSYPDYLIYWFQIFYKNQSVILKPYVCCDTNAYDWKDQNIDEPDILIPLLTYSKNKHVSINELQNTICKVVVRIFGSGNNPEVVSVKPKKHTKDGLMPTFLKGVCL